MNKFDLAIIGGGFSGSALAFHLQKESSFPFSVVIIEPRKVIGAGVAYETQDPAHLLNVPAIKMTIDDSDPGSFARWLKNNSLPYEADSFVPRYLYQKYISDMLQSTKSNIKLEIKNDHVVSISQTINGSYELNSKDGSKFIAKNIVLAVGNSPNGVMKSGLEPLTKSPWDKDALDLASKAKEVAVIGTGLSAVDAVLALENRAFKGRYTLVSRSGFLPKPHPLSHSTDQTTESIAAKIREFKSLQGVLKEFRKALSNGCDWHNLIDAMRPSLQSIWGSFNIKDKKRFIRHLLPFWDTHRHRVPRDSLQKILDLVSDNRLKIIRSKVYSHSIHNKKIWLSISNSTNEALGPYDVVFNCTGLWSNLREAQSPLIENMIRNNLASYDDLALGLRADHNGQLLSPKNKLVDGIYTLGSLRRGELWESTAVREIRSQAMNLAKRILSSAVINEQTETPPLRVASL